MPLASRRTKDAGRREFRPVSDDCRCGPAWYGRCAQHPWTTSSVSVEPDHMSTRHPRRSHTADDTQMAREVDSLINTMGVDPMAIEVNGEQQPDIREAAAAPADAPAPAPGPDDTVWKNTIDPEVHAAELALVEAHAKAKLAVELERVKAEAAAQRQAELASQEAAATAERERAVAEARSQAETAARESMASELARARTEAEQQLARELERSREQMERQLSERLGQSRVDADRDREDNLARARAEAEATRAAAVQEARQAAEAADRKSTRLNSSH